MSDEEKQTRDLIGQWLGNGGVTLLEQPKEVIIIPALWEIAHARARHKIGEVKMPRGYNEKSFYLGKDGRSYDGAKALEAANEEWKRNTMFYIGKDGQHYSTAGELARANEEWKRKTFSAKRNPIFDRKG